MLCPICKLELKIADRQGIEIDYCSKCRGIWLDRGELDKIIERSSQVQESFQKGQSKHQSYNKPIHDNMPLQYSMDTRPPQHYKKQNKVSSFLGEIFDFD